MTHLPKSLIDQLDLESALQDELQHVPDLLPKQIVDQALSANSAGVAEQFRQFALGEVPVQPAAKMVASKWRHGRRTIAVLPLYERVLYRAVVDSISTELVPRVRGKEAYTDFQQSPFSLADTANVVMADIANYYASINIDAVAAELLKRTGKWAQVEWLKHFWSVTSDGYGGIPQMNVSSDVIGDTYADLLHRRLLRHGLAAWRYADDFRIACASYGQCVTALEALDEATRSLGLSLNERKTLTPSNSRYREIIEGPQRRLAQINETVREDLTRFDTYTWDEVTPEDAEILLEGAIRVIELWLEEESGAETELPDLTQLLPQTLIVLGISKEPRALEAVPKLLRLEPQLTPTICQYMRLILPEHDFAVNEAIRQSISTLTLTKWQRLWILHVLEEVRTIKDPWGDQSVADWMHEQVRDPSVPLRCQAVWSLSRSLDLTREEWALLDVDGSDYQLYYSAASIHGVKDPDKHKLEGFGAVELISKAVSEWSKSTHFAPPF